MKPPHGGLPVHGGSVGTDIVLGGLQKPGGESDVAARGAMCSMNPFNWLRNEEDMRCLYFHAFLPRYW